MLPVLQLLGDAYGFQFHFASLSNEKALYEQDFPQDKPPAASRLFGDRFFVFFAMYT